jgi:hypothetical protein
MYFIVVLLQVWAPSGALTIGRSQPPVLDILSAHFREAATPRVNHHRHTTTRPVDARSSARRKVSGV